MSEFNSAADGVPAGGRHDLVTVDGRCFAISAEAGDMVAGTHGLVYDDLRHLSRLQLTVNGDRVELLGASTPTPLSAVVVSRVVARVDGDGDGDGADPGQGTIGTEHRGDHAGVLLIRRRSLAGCLLEELTLRNPHPMPVSVHVQLEVAADFAHVFDVKSGTADRERASVAVDPSGTWTLGSPRDPQDSTRVLMEPRPDEVDPDGGAATWRLQVPGQGEVTVAVTVQPVSAGVPADLERPAALARGTAVRELSAWRAGLPSAVSLDPRLPTAIDQALIDLAALRIVDEAHPERTVVAAGAPWFMTLFGRDSLLTAWMTLPFDGSLAAGVLAGLAELQGRVDDPASEEQPGRIVHELRRHGGSGPFSSRNRYYGTVDATPLFVALAAEAWRWRAIDEGTLRDLAPAVGRAIDWTIGAGDSNGDGFVDYRRRDAHGLANQGWKDSWDGITRADGTLPQAPLALVEVQGYAYAALTGAAALATTVDIGHDADDLLRRAQVLKDRFNETFWDRRGWFVLGLDGDGRPIDSLTTNPGHALWSGIADDDKARQYVERLVDRDLWTGWGLRTLASSMAAYDPLSYHNGSVWPHDTALCVAGAARYGHWDAVDLLVDGALEATRHFGGRPPELFAGLSRDDVAMPVAYPSSCSPQAWASASVLLLVRTMLGLEPTADGSGVELVRGDLSGVPDLALSALEFAGRPMSVDVQAGSGRVTLGPSAQPWSSGP
ncbi:amylo-alpha-1,6-glucosidase [Nocardioides sp. CGMCC 1.13656]|nr:MULTISPECIES: glycogen debranching N-terminal domain-containing protein [unclassified Nocardioides]MBA2952485.1 amylo-alpha-1,6-glucosidase [Nocardioides sp. CGMCC 1.13656]